MHHKGSISVQLQRWRRNLLRWRIKTAEIFISFSFCILRWKSSKRLCATQTYTIVKCFFAQPSLQNMFESFAAKKESQIECNCNEYEFTSRMQFFFFFIYESHQQLNSEKAQLKLVPLTHTIKCKTIRLLTTKREHAMIYELREKKNTFHS